ncbi:MAG: hypothetical protein WAS51_11270 [Ilumatobacteraceae bacterium]
MRRRTARIVVTAVVAGVLLVGAAAQAARGADEPIPAMPGAVHP